MLDLSQIAMVAERYELAQRLTDLARQAEELVAQLAREQAEEEKP